MSNHDNPNSVPSSGIPDRETQDKLTTQRLLGDAALVQSGRAYFINGKFVVGAEGQDAARKQMTYKLWRDERADKAWREQRFHEHKKTRQPQEDFLVTKEDLLEFAELSGTKTNTVSHGWNSMMKEIWQARQSGSATLKVVELTPEAYISYRSSEDIALSGRSLFDRIQADMLNRTYGLGKQSDQFIADYLSYKLFDMEQLANQGTMPASVAAPEHQ